MTKYPLRVVFFGTPEFVVPVLNTLKDNFNLAGVVTAPDKPVGRKQTLTPSPVKLSLQGQALQGCPVLTPEKLTTDVAQQLQHLQPDLIVVAAYGKIIPQFILDLPTYGALNVHPSCLPKYRGPSPIQTTILNGDKTSCITIIKMDEKMDHGPIVATRGISLSDQDTFDTLSKMMFHEGAELLTQIISKYIEGKIKLIEQNHDNATFTKIIHKEDGYFDINNPPSPEKLDQMIRAFYPWPNVWTRFRQGSSGQARIVKFLPGGLVQMEGKKAVKLEDFLRGYPEFPIKSLR